MTIIGALMGFLLLSGAVGAAPTLASAPTIPSYSVTLTAYNAVPEQTDDDPLVTASGAYSNPQIIAARSRDLAKELPFGTIIAISAPSEDAKNTCGYSIVEPIIGYRVIADTMNARYTSRIDVLFDTEANYRLADGKTKNAGTVLGICDNVTIRVVGHVDINRIPKTQAALRTLVYGQNTLAVK